MVIRPEDTGVVEIVLDLRTLVASLQPGERIVLERRTRGEVRVACEDTRHSCEAWIGDDELAATTDKDLVADAIMRARKTVRDNADPSPHKVPDR